MAVFSSFRTNDVRSAAATQQEAKHEMDHP
jgi:hypothetical protein